MIAGSPEHKEYQRRWYQENREAILKRRSEYWFKNRDKEKAAGACHRQTPEYSYSSYKGSAKRDRRIFTLTFEEFLSFWQQPCTYCGNDIEKIGLDRVDNSKGYVLTNVVPCCTICNTWKHTMTKNEFFERINRIAARLK